MKRTDRVVLLAAKRTPHGNFNGAFIDTPATKLASGAIQSALAELTLYPEDVDGVYLGCVLPAGLGQAPARQAALGADLPLHVPCTTVNKMCGSGMQTVIMAHDSLVAGSHKVMIAGGMENMSRAPYLLPGARQGYRMGHQKVYDHMLLDGLQDAYGKNHHMGYYAEKCAEKFHISRQAQDEFALKSIEKARQATKEGWFQSEMAPVTVFRKKQENLISVDEGPFSINPEKIAELPPVFQEEGTITAGNASSLADGASILILTTESHAQKLGLKPLATLIGHYTHAQDPSNFTTAPIAAMNGLMQKIGWKLNQVDLFEINEAFAIVTLVAIQELKLNYQRVNVHGGACILGHPIGASGARIIVTLAHALKKHRLKRGVASLCIGGGEATAIAIEAGPG